MAKSKKEKKSVVKDIVSKIYSNNMIMDVELLWKLHHQNKEIVEVPTIWTDQPGSAMLDKRSSFIKVAFKMFFSLLRLRLQGPNH